MSLAARGHVVTRLSFRRLYPQLVFPGRSQYEPDSAPTATSAGVDGEDARTRTDAAAGSPQLSPPAALLDSVGPASWLRVARLAGSAEAAICEWWHPFFAPALGTIAAVLRRRGVPAIFVCHNLEPHEPVPGGAWLTRLALGRASAFIAQSNADAARLRARYPRRPLALVLPPAAPPPSCAHGGERRSCADALALPPASARVLFFGYVRAYKGLPTLIDAMARISPAVQLVVAGEIYDRDAAYYRALALRAGVADRVVVLDRFLAEREIACCFAAADVVALPYWTASQSAVAPLAMACGRAVVASAVGGLTDLVRDGETGLLVPPRDAAALATALERALANAPVWGVAAARRAQGWSWPAAAEAVEDVVVSAHAAPW